MISPPSTFRSRSTSRLLLTLVVPLVAPISIAVAAPNAFTVVALVFSKLNVVWLVVRSPPSILTSLSKSTLAVLNVINSEPLVVSNAIYSEDPSLTKKALVALSSTRILTLARSLPSAKSSEPSVVSTSRYLSDPC